MKHGDKIYVPTAMYIDRGEDDVKGGWATVETVTQTQYGTWVTTIQIPGRRYNAVLLGADQENLKEKYGDQEAQPDPDMHPKPNPTAEQLAELYASEYLTEVVQLARAGKPYKELLPSLKYWTKKAPSILSIVERIVKSLE